MKPSDILEKHNLSKTKSRKEMLSVFIKNHTALSEREIQKELNEKYNRATIYRNLNVFAETGIIHLINSDGGQAKYLLKKQPEEHLHFECSVCNSIICITETGIPEYQLPDGFIKKETSFLIKGICKKCN